MRSWIAWGLIVAYVPLFAVVGAQLRPWGDFDAAALQTRGWGYAGGAALLGALAVGLGPALRRVEPAAAAMIRWHLAEGVGICGLLAWIEGGSGAQFAVHAAATLALLVWLRPAWVASPAAR